MRLETYPDREMLVIGVVNRLASDLGEALRSKERVGFAVPGGSTPGPFFDALSDVDLEWDRVTVLPSDERWVPEAAEHSNARLIKSRLFRGKAAKASFLPLYTDGDGAQAVDALSATLKPLLPLSVLLLGMGADMHIASLFPGGAALRPEHRQNGSANLHFVKVPG